MLYLIEDYQRIFRDFLSSECGQFIQYPFRVQIAEYIRQLWIAFEVETYIIFEMSLPEFRQYECLPALAYPQ